MSNGQRQTIAAWGAISRPWRVLAAITLAGSFAIPNRSVAQAAPPTCASLNLTNPLYVAGTSTGNAMLQQVALILANQANIFADATIVYQQMDSCAALGEAASTSSCSVGSTQCMNGTATYYTGLSGNVTSNTCTLPAAGVQVDIALSDVFPATCNVGITPGKATLIQGPVRGLVFVEPLNGVLCDPGAEVCNRSVGGGASQTACCPICDLCLGDLGSCPASTTLPKGISAEQAYFVLGFPGGGGVAPWTNPLNVFLPGPSSMEEQILSTVLGIPADAMLGVDETANGGDPGVVAAMSSATNSVSTGTLGLVSTDYYDANRNPPMNQPPPPVALTALAYRAAGQKRAYYPDLNSIPNTTGFPDASIDTFEKQNIRDGHYVLWGYLQALVRTSSTVAGQAAAQFGTFFQGMSPNAGLGASNYNIAHGAIQSNLIPQCAMSVQRTQEGGELTPFSPGSGQTCNCLFEASVSGGVPMGCKSCSTASGCTSGSCNYGYCEGP